MKKLDYHNWFYSECGEFAKEDDFKHYMIITSNFVIDVISTFEPTVIIK